MLPGCLFSRLRVAWVLCSVVLLVTVGVSNGQPPPAAPEKQKKARPGQRPFSQPIAPSAPSAALLRTESWQQASTAAIEPGEIDRLLDAELQRLQIEPAPRTTDEQFLRRVTLDLTGKLPVPAELGDFVADSDPYKRAKIIDRLLESDEYARHWAAYWRDVLTARLTDRRGLALARPFEEWMYRQLKANRSWGEIARALITAEGACHFDDDGQNGALFLLASRIGNDAVNEQAAEVSRVFLGIQIQCAQCHDHPSDQWKRVQFHELAAYFARVRSRPVRDGQRLAGFQLVASRAGEHTMPSTDDPGQSFVVHPRFLNGQAAGVNQDDRQRRQALAKAITDKDNYWFAAAFVNRMWGELLGQAFYQPVDDMGPQKEVVFPAVLTRLTGSFRGSDYDIKALLRAILNTQAYQRQARPDAASDHQHFATVVPTRLRADSLWESVVTVLGNPASPFRGADRERPKTGPVLQRLSLEGQFKEEFKFDPSLKADDVEGSIAQALLLMNNPQLHQRLRAQGTNLLARILAHYRDDKEAIRMIYLRVLARKPTDRELEKCQKHLRESGNRAEALEDVLWALLNSTEFQTRR